MSENCCSGNDKVELNVEKTDKGVKIEVAPKSSCSTTKDASAAKPEEKKGNSCGCC